MDRKVHSNPQVVARACNRLRVLHDVERVNALLEEKVVCAQMFDFIPPRGITNGTTRQHLAHLDRYAGSEPLLWIQSNSECFLCTRNAT